MELAADLIAGDLQVVGSGVNAVSGIPTDDILSNRDGVGGAHDMNAVSAICVASVAAHPDGIAGDGKIRRAAGDEDTMPAVSGNDVARIAVSDGDGRSADDSDARTSVAHRTTFGSFLQTNGVFCDHVIVPGKDDS